MKTTLYHLKGLKDIELAPLFLERYMPYFETKYKGYLLIPAPSTRESDNIRGFNHVTAIFEGLKRPFLGVITKKVDFKQSDLSYVERQMVSHKLEIKAGHLIKGKKVLIVDDIKTSGATLKAIINLIRPFHPKKIEILVIARTKVNT
jgi:competence protein ComFC